MPSAVPRPRTNHVDISFSAGGYTPARQAPVRKRSGIAVAAPEGRQRGRGSRPRRRTSPRRSRAAAERTSARFTTDEKSAPATKPSWTAIVSQAPAVVPSCHSARSCGRTADAENQVDIESTSATASRPSDREACLNAARSPDSRTRQPYGLALDRITCNRYVTRCASRRRDRRSQFRRRVLELVRDDELPCGRNRGTVPGQPSCCLAALARTPRVGPRARTPRRDESGFTVPTPAHWPSSAPGSTATGQAGSTRSSDLPRRRDDRDGRAADGGGRCTARAGLGAPDGHGRVAALVAGRGRARAARGRTRRPGVRPRRRHRRGDELGAAGSARLHLGGVAHARRTAPCHLHCRRPWRRPFACRRHPLGFADAPAEVREAATGGWSYFLPRLAEAA